MLRGKFVYRGLLVLTGALLWPVSSGADQVNFDSPGQLGANFTINNQTGSGGYTEMPSGGISNSGAVDVTTGPSNTLDATAVYNKLSFNPQNGPITVSEFVKVQSTATGDRLLHLGIIDDTGATHQLNGGGAARSDFISARMSPNSATVGTTTPYAFQAQSGQSDGVAATATTNSASSSAVNLTVGNWYKFTVNFSLGAANTFNVVGAIQDFGIDGATPGALTVFPSQSLTTNTTDMYNDPTVFGAFRSFASTGGADALDNFSIIQTVPEPGSLGVCLLAGLMSVGARRRRAANA
jgi:hypothetical protein